MSRRYSYVGPTEIRQLPTQSPYRTLIASADDMVRWIMENHPILHRLHAATATFIIDLAEQLWLADQSSEHVACAAGQDVLAAGEITFSLNANNLAVSEITNQSTGYCPEPESWEVVVGVLNRLSLPHPAAFTTSFLFRRCTTCGTTNIIKDNWFECAVCQAPLSQEWNY